MTERARLRTPQVNAYSQQLNAHNKGHLLDSPNISIVCVPRMKTGDRERLSACTGAKNGIIERVGVWPWRNGHKEGHPPPGWEQGVEEEKDTFLSAEKKEFNRLSWPDGTLRRRMEGVDDLDEWLHTQKGQKDEKNILEGPEREADSYIITHWWSELMHCFNPNKYCIEQPKLHISTHIKRHYTRSLIHEKEMFEENRIYFKVSTPPIIFPA